MSGTLKEIADYISEFMRNNPDSPEITIRMSRTKAEALLSELPGDSPPEAVQYNKEFQRSINMMSELTGFSPSVILNQRNYPFYLYRAIIAAHLRSMGVTLSMIGELLGRDHSSISYYLKIIEDNNGNPTMRDIYDVKSKFDAKINSPMTDGIVSLPDKDK